MATGLGRLTVDMILRTGLFDAGLDKAARKAKQTTKQISDDAQKAAEVTKAAFSSLSGVIGGAIGTLSAGAVVKKVIDNTIQMEREQTQLAAVLRSTGEAAGYTRTQLNLMAGALADDSTFSTGAINQAQTTLLAFTGIMGNEFVRAQQAAADMAARTGMAFTASSETIGRALDIPSKGLTALTRQGFRFTEAQAKIALQLENSGRVAEAQAIILDALEESYGGAAKAARETFGGALQGLSNTIGNLLTGGEGSLEEARIAVEELNSALASPEAQQAYASLVSSIIEGSTALIKVLTAIPWEYTADAVIALSTVIGARLVASLASSAISFVAAAIPVVRYNIAVIALSSSLSGASTAMGVLSAASAAAGRALAVVGGPLGAAIIAGTALYAVINSATRSNDDYKKSLEALNGPIEEVTKRLQDMTRDQRQSSLAAAEAAVDAQKKVVVQSIRELENELAAALSGQFIGSNAQFDGFLANIQEAITNGESLYDVLKKGEQAGFISDTAILSVIKYSSEVDNQRKELVNLEGRAREVAAAISAIGASAAGAASGVGVLTEEMARALESGSDYAQKLADRLITAGLKTETQKFDAMVKAGQLAFESEERMNEVRKQALEYDKRITASSKTASSEAKKQATEIQSVLDKLLPMEKITRDYQKEQEILNNAQKTGKINSEQYAVAMVNLNRQRDEAVRNLIPEEIKRMKELENTFNSTMASTQRQTELMLATLGMGKDAKELAQNLGQVEEKYRRIAETMALSPQGASEQDLAILADYMAQEMAMVESAHARKMELNESWLFGMQSGLQAYIDSVGSTSEQVAGLMTSAFGHVEDALFDLVTKGELDIGGLLRSIGQDVVRMLIQMGTQMAANFLMAQMFGTAATATASLQGAAMASAYAPAAAMASLASFGGNAIPASAGITTTVGLAQGLAFAGMFDNGGFIPSGSYGIAGEIGPEIVSGPAYVTSRNDTARMLQGSANQSGNGDTIVQFYGNPDAVQSVDTDTNEFGQRVIRVMLNDLAGGGEYSTSLIRSTNVQRVPR